MMKRLLAPGVGVKAGFKRWLFRLAVFLIATSLVAICALLFWSRSASQEWRRTKSQLLAEGEFFDLKSLLPPPPSENENFCAIPELKDVVALELDFTQVPRKAIRPLTNVWSEPVYHSGIGSGPREGLTANVSMLAGYFRKNGQIKMPPESNSPGRDLLVAVDERSSGISALAAAVGRPHSQFMPTPSQRQWPEHLFDRRDLQWDAVSKVGHALKLRAIAASSVGDAQVARSSILALLKLADAASHEPFLLGFVNALSMERMSHEVLWEALRARVLSEDELAEISSELEKHDIREQLLYAIRTDLILGVNEIENLRDKNRQNFLAELASFNGPVMRAASRCVPAGVLDRNATFYCNELYERSIRPLKAHDLLTAVHELQSLDCMTHEIGHDGDNPLRVFSEGIASFLLSATPVLVRKGSVTASAHDQAITALALERFYLHHQRYPETLSELVPDFIPKPPIDTLTGIPLGYRRTDDGRYMIWSAGFDGEDDGGKVGELTKPAERLTYLEFTNYKGDWVWQYTPVHP